MTLQTSPRFPSYQWAWPGGNLDQLLVAALAVDHTEALTAFEQWLADNDLDSATFSEHRLLAAIVERLGRSIASWPEYPRLQGLQRLNWTKSRMTVHESLPAIKAMADRGLRVILVKGAARVAENPTEQKSRTSYDIDVLMDDADFEAAFEILAGDGWQSTRGESVMGLRGRLSTVRARNFKKGRFGDIDLHRKAYRPENQNDLADAALLQTAIPRSYFDAPVFIPTPEERLAMAIAHGGWDGHSHSDWLVDCGTIIRTNSVDWVEFGNIIQQRNLYTGAMIALSYLCTRMGLPLDAEIRRLETLAPRFDAITRIPDLVLAKDETALNTPTKSLRRLIVLLRRFNLSGRNTAVDTPRIYGRIKRAVTGGDAAARTAVAQIHAAHTGKVRIDLEMELDLPAARRRVEFELNSADRNIAHFTLLSLRENERRVVVRFTGKTVLQDGETDLELRAMPGKFMDDDEHRAEVLAKYRAVPFTILGKATFNTC